MRVTASTANASFNFLMRSNGVAFMWFAGLSAFGVPLMVLFSLPNPLPNAEAACGSFPLVE